jgi:hypothetical protein
LSARVMTLTSGGGMTAPWPPGGWPVEGLQAESKTGSAHNNVEAILEGVHVVVMSVMCKGN